MKPPIKTRKISPKHLGKVAGAGKLSPDSIAPKDGRISVVKVLPASDECLAALLENVGSALFGLAVESRGRFRFVSANAAFEKATGSNHRKIIGKLVSEVVRESSSGVFVKKLREVIRGGEAVRWEQISVFSKEVRVSEFSVTPVRDRQGRVTVLAGTVTDVTEAVALRENEERYRRIVQTVQEGVWTINADSLTDYVNPKMAQMMGYEADEMIGRPIDDFLDDEGRGMLAALITRRKGGISEQFEFKYVRKDGSSLWAFVSTNPIIDSRGKYVGAVALLTDVSARREAERALRESEERYRLLADYCNDIVGLNDTDGSRLYISPSYTRKTGWTLEDLGHSSWRTRIHPADYAVVERARKENLAGKDTEIAHRVLCKDGSSLWFETSCKPVCGPDGRVWRFLVWSRDITKRKHAEDALRESEIQFRAIFEQAAVGVAVVDSNTGQFLKVNQKTCDIARLTRDQMLKTTFMDISHPDDLEADLKQMKRLKAGKLNAFTMEKRYLHANGEITWVNRTVSPMWAPGEAPTRHVAIVEDITARKQAEEALTRTADLLARTGEMAKVGGWELDLTTNMLFWSPETCRIFELGEAVAPPLEEAIAYYPPEARPIIQAAVKTAIVKGIAYDLELPVITAKGRKLWTRSQGSAVRAGRKVTKLIGTFQDITEHKVAELALRESEARFRAIFEQASVGVALMDTTSGRFIDANKRCCEIIGLSREKLTPTTFMEITHPDDLPMALENVAKLKEGRVRSYSMEKRNVLPGGEIKWINLSVAAMWEKGEAPTRHIAVIEDISDRKNAEAKYLRELEFNRTLVDHTSVIIVLLDRQGRMEYVNEATVNFLGFSRKELLGRTPWEVGIMSSEERIRAVERLQVLLKGGSNPPRETILTDKSGVGHVFSLSSLSTKAPDGTIDRIIVTGADLTERNRLQREILKVSEQEQARIGHNLHDGVGQTMTGVASLMSALEIELVGEPKASAARICELVQKAVQEIRGMSHSMSPAAVKNRGLGGVLQLLADMISTNHRIACTFDFDPDIQVADSEKETHIYRIAQEAANNALRHGGPTKISISLRRHGDKECMLTVEDNGKGISKADAARSDGIGLQVMDYRANLIGGTLKIISKKHRGVSLICYFPCARSVVRKR